MKESEVDRFYQYCITGFHPLMPTREFVKGVRGASQHVRTERALARKKKFAFKTKKLNRCGFAVSGFYTNHGFVKDDVVVHGKDVNIREFLNDGCGRKVNSSCRLVDCWVFLFDSLQNVW